MEINQNDFFNSGNNEESKVKENLMNTNEIINIELDKLVDYRRGQPFSEYTDEKKEEMKKSIQKRGILQPIIIRKIDDDKYEIIAGHNRARCCRELEMKTIPAHIVECDDENATLIMLETNLCARENIPIMEKSNAYKLQLETITKLKEKQKEENMDFPVGNTWDNVVGESEDSQTQIHRYIRLTYLIKELQEEIDKGNLSIRAGVELSYIESEEQEIIYSVIKDENIKVTLAQAEKLRAINGEISYQVVLDILKGNKVKVEKFTGKIEKRAFNIYKDKFSNDTEFTDLILELLEQHFKEGDYITE
ncbi:MAG: ParB/RepB/Spo0J family partition protein [Clostridia bacterium]|nr:ParB/RepB/Spo0J family partition protein [Clostridia bacterium]